MSESSPPRTLAPGRLNRILKKRAADEAAMEWSSIEVDDDEVDPTLITVPVRLVDLSGAVTVNAPHLTQRLHIEVA